MTAFYNSCSLDRNLEFFTENKNDKARKRSGLAICENMGKIW